MVVNLGNREGAPIFESANGATVNFYQHDLTGYSGAQIVATTDIRVDSGTTMNLIPYGNGTTYYRGRYTIEPGAVLTSYFSQEVYGGSTFRMHGGAVEGYEQIYVPASDSSAHAVINGDSTSNGKLHIHTDATTGFGIFVGEGSTLDFDLAITSKDNNAPIAKWGAGTLCLNRDMSGYMGTLAICAGKVCITNSTTLASVVNNAGATLAFSCAAQPTISSYSGMGAVLIDVSTLVSGGVIASGTHVIGPSCIPSACVTVVGLPENSGFVVSSTEEGVVLTDQIVFSPEWTGPTNTWTSSSFDGRTGNTEGLAVIFSQSTTPFDAVAVTVSGNKSVKSLAFISSSTAYTLTGDRITTTEGVSISGASPVEIGNALSIGGDLSLGSEALLTLKSADLALADGALKGAGTLTLDFGEGTTNTMTSGNTLFTGNAVIASGTVKMADKNAFGALARSGAIRVKGGATLSTGCNNGATEGETNRLILEEGATYTSYASLNDNKLFPISHLTLAGNANIVADVANIGITKHYNDPLGIDMNGYTLTKTGNNTLHIAAATIAGEGVIRIAEGTLSINSGYYTGVQNETKFSNGTLMVDAGAVVHLNHYMRDATLTVKNLVLNGSVTQFTNDGTGTSTLTVTGYVTGSGATPILTLASGAVFKPTGTGYLTITDSLNGTMRVDLGDIDMAHMGAVPLFKVGSAELLPEVEDIVFVDALPRGWVLKVTSDGCGYRLSKQAFDIRLR